MPASVRRAYAIVAACFALTFLMGAQHWNLSERRVGAPGYRRACILEPGWNLANFITTHDRVWTAAEVVSLHKAYPDCWMELGIIGGADVTGYGSVTGFADDVATWRAAVVAAGLEFRMVFDHRADGVMRWVLDTRTNEYGPTGDKTLMCRAGSVAGGVDAPDGPNVCTTLMGDLEERFGAAVSPPFDVPAITDDHILRIRRGGTYGWNSMRNTEWSGLDPCDAASDATWGPQDKAKFCSSPDLVETCFGGDNHGEACSSNVYCNVTGGPDVSWDPIIDDDTFGYCAAPVIYGELTDNTADAPPAVRLSIAGFALDMRSEDVQDFVAWRALARMYDLGFTKGDRVGPHLALKTANWSTPTTVATNTDCWVTGTSWRGIPTIAGLSQGCTSAIPLLPTPYTNAEVAAWQNAVIQKIDALMTWDGWTDGVITTVENAPAGYIGPGDEPTTQPWIYLTRDTIEMTRLIGDAENVRAPAPSSIITPSDPAPTPACADGDDNDGDGKIDFGTGEGNDPGCTSSSDNDELGTTQCDNGIDDDGDADGIDMLDPDCGSPLDDDESTPVFACGNGDDDDGDGLTDHPNDPGCLSAADTSERELGGAQCDDTIDNDLDGLTDYPADNSCSGPSDDGELTTGEDACNDGQDNDGDGDIDYPADAGCRDANDPSEDGPYAITSLPTGMVWLDSFAAGANEMDQYQTTPMPTDSLDAFKFRCYWNCDKLLYEDDPYSLGSTPGVIRLTGTGHPVFSGGVWGGGSGDSQPKADRVLVDFAFKADCDNWLQAGGGKTFYWSQKDEANHYFTTIGGAAGDCRPGGTGGPCQMHSTVQHDDATIGGDFVSQNYEYTWDPFAGNCPWRQITTYFEQGSMGGKDGKSWAKINGVDVPLSEGVHYGTQNTIPFLPPIGAGTPPVVSKDNFIVEDIYWNDTVNTTLERQILYDSIRIAVGWSCSDGADNDGDGLTDTNDPGCTGTTDTNEDNIPAVSGGGAINQTGNANIQLLTVTDADSAEVIVFTEGTCDDDGGPDTFDSYSIDADGTLSGFANLTGSCTWTWTVNDAKNPQQTGSVTVNITEQVAGTPGDGCDCATSGESPYCEDNQVTMTGPSGPSGAHSVTVTFDTDYLCGQYANGDFWVQGSSVTVASTTPTPSSGMHGYQANPDAYEQSIEDNGNQDNSRWAYVSPDSLPQAYSTSSGPVSFIKGYSRPNVGGNYPCDTGDGNRETCLFLTPVVTFVGTSGALDADSDNDGRTDDEFRPGHYGTTKLGPFTTDQMTTRIATLGQYDVDAMDWESQVTFAGIASRYGKSCSWMWAGHEVLQRMIPNDCSYQNDLPGGANTYGGSISAVNNSVPMRFLLDDFNYNTTTHKAALIAYVQAGIDFANYIEAGGRTNNGHLTADLTGNDFDIAAGGIFAGNKSPVAFAAYMLDSAAIRGVIADDFMHEDRFVFVGTDGVRHSGFTYPNTPLCQTPDPATNVQQCAPNTTSDAGCGYTGGAGGYWNQFGWQYAAAASWVSALGSAAWTAWGDDDFIWRYRSFMPNSGDYDNQLFVPLGTGHTQTTWSTTSSGTNCRNAEGNTGYLPLFAREFVQDFSGSFPSPP